MIFKSGGSSNNSTPTSLPYTPSLSFSRNDKNISRSASKSQFKMAHFSPSPRSFHSSAEKYQRGVATNFNTSLGYNQQMQQQPVFQVPKPPITSMHTESDHLLKARYGIQDDSGRGGDSIRHLVIDNNGGISGGNGKGYRRKRGNSFQEDLSDDHQYKKKKLDHDNRKKSSDGDVEMLQVSRILSRGWKRKNPPEGSDENNKITKKMFISNNVSSQSAEIKTNSDLAERDNIVSKYNNSIKSDKKKTQQFSVDSDGFNIPAPPITKVKSDTTPSISESINNHQDEVLNRELPSNLLPSHKEQENSKLFLRVKKKDSNLDNSSQLELTKMDFDGKDFISTDLGTLPNKVGRTHLRIASGGSHRTNTSNKSLESIYSAIVKDREDADMEVKNILMRKIVEPSKLELLSKLELPISKSDVTANQQVPPVSISINDINKAAPVFAFNSNPPLSTPPVPSFSSNPTPPPLFGSDLNTNNQVTSNPFGFGTVGGITLISYQIFFPYITAINTNMA